MTTKRHVALIAPADESRAALAAYLRSAGFDAHECSELELSRAFTALVVISPHETSGDRLVAEMRSWLKATKHQRIVVVTSKPSALKDLVAVHGERLCVLPAPAFGWSVVDALRISEPNKPRGA
jgi:uroporphyrinogen-III synthase